MNQGWFPTFHQIMRRERVTRETPVTQLNPEFHFHQVDNSNTMRIAVIGAKGQLGSDLVSGLGSQAIAMTRSEIDITDASSVWNVLDMNRPNAVVNCAAYNFVDKAENERDAAMLTNCRGPGFLADYCRERDLKLVHIGTDFVFDGCTGHTPWSENDNPIPLSTYALSKFAGEQLVREHCPRHFVLRTCGLYGRNATHGKGNFVETMIRLGKERSEVRVVDDQRCTPTATINLAAAIIDLLKTDEYGLYHATNSDQCTWFEFASEVFRLADLPARLIPISTEEYDARARRPKFSVLDCSKLTSVIGWKMPPWKDALSRYLFERRR